MFLRFLRALQKAMALSTIALSALMSLGCADAIPQLTSLLSSKAQPVAGLEFAVLKESGTQVVVAPQAILGFSKTMYLIDIDEATVESYRYQLIEAAGTCPGSATGSILSSDSSFSTSLLPTVMDFRLCLWVTTKPGITPPLVDSLSEQVWSLSPQVVVTGVHGANGAYGLGSVLNLSVRFSGPIQLQSGAPRLALAMSGRDAQFLAAAGSDLLFNYAIVAGDLAVDLDVDFLSLNGSILVDSYGEAVSVAIPAGISLANLYDIQIDAVPPLKPNLAMAGGFSNPSSNLNPNFIVSNLTAGEYLWLKKGSCADPNVATWTSGDSTLAVAWTQAFGALSPGLNSFVVKAVDPVGNSTCSDPYYYDLDTTPYLAISSVANPYVGMMNTSPRDIQITVTDLNGLPMTDFTSNLSTTVQFLRGGSDAGCNLLAESGSGNVRTLSVAQCQGDGPIDIQLPAGGVTSSLGVLSPFAQLSSVLIADNTPPTATVSFSNYTYPNFAVDRSSPTMQWSSPLDTGSGFKDVFVGVGTSGGLLDIFDWITGAGASATFDPGPFLYGNRYSMNFKVVDNVGNESYVSSVDWRHHCSPTGFCNQAFLKSVNSITNDFTQDSFAGTVLKQSGNYLAVGAPGKRVNGVPGAGAIYFYEYKPSGWIKVGEVLNPSPNDIRFFGQSLVFEGDKLIVGAPGDNSMSGAVLLYKFVTGSWVEKSRTRYNLSFVGLGGGQGQPGDLFGHALDYSPSTSRLVVGSPGSIQNGRADMIEVNWDTYVLTWKVGFSASGILTNVGTSVAISSDGSTVVAGARRLSVLSNAYIFTDMLDWTNPHVLTDALNSTGYGQSVSISANGDRVAVGAPLDDKVYVYERGGGSYSNSPVIVGTHYDQSLHVDRLGESVQFSPSGDRLFIGASRSKIDIPTGIYGSLSFGAVPRGAVVEYFFNGSSWQPKRHFSPSGVMHESDFGSAIAFKGNGGLSTSNLLFVGAPQDSISNQIVNSSNVTGGLVGTGEHYRAGAVHVFASEPEN